MRGRWSFGTRWWSRVNAPLVAAAGATILCLSVYAGHRAGFWSVPGLDAAENATIDARFRLRGEREVLDDGIVIVGLDDRTRTEAPELIQTRRGWARLITELARFSPRVIGIDAFFANPEVNLTPETVAKVREAAAGLAGESELSAAGGAAKDALSAVIEETRGDEILAEAIGRAGTVYLGFAFHLAELDEDAPASAPERLATNKARFGEAVSVEAPARLRPARATWVSASMDPIAAGAAGAGYVNIQTDEDGHTRLALLVLEHGGRFYMPLGMAMAAASFDRNPLTSFVVGEDRVGFGDRALPVDSRGRAWVSYLGPAKTFPHVPAVDVLRGDVERSRLEGKLVLIGYTDTFRDTLATPFDPQFPGVEYHATLIHNILHGELLRRASPWTTLLTIALMGVFLTTLQLRRVRQQRAWIIGAGIGLMVLGYFLFAQIVFAAQDVIVDVVAPVGGGLLISLASLSVGLVTEGREKAQIRDVFSQYVQDTVVERILANPRRTAVLGGERRELTVLFSDIRGFSAISEQLEPEVLSNYLNQYFTPMTQLIMSNEGLLDKYIGDAVMAVYGAPLDQSDHASRACRTALAMIAALDPLNDRWAKDGIDTRISIGIGINTGPMSVGNMGSEARFDYTVLGDAVNLGARLEGLTKQYGVDILVGERTEQAASGAFVFRELDTVRVKGREGTARIYELVGTAESSPLSDDDLATYDAALTAYREGDWDAAQEAFEAFLEEHPDDGPAPVMLDRIAALRERDPGDRWDGVFEQVSK